MDTRTLTQALKKISNMYDRNVFYGVYSCDELEQLEPPIQTKIALIINTDPSNKPGMHWQCLWIIDDRTSYFFDSYGRPPTNHYIKEFIKKNSNETVWKNQQLQSFDSLLCGEYCCIFLWNMWDGLSIDNFYKLFSKNGIDYEKNDKQLRKLYKDMFGCKLCAQKTLQTCKSFNCYSKNE